MKISVFGLGYVGTVSAACFAESGHDVIGVDVNSDKVELVNKGVPPVIEKGLSGLVKKARKRGTLQAVTSAEEAVGWSEISLICVGTPSNPNSSLNLEYVVRVSREIGGALREKKAPHVVCVRSTMVPGSTEEYVIPALEDGLGGKMPGRIRVAVNPEFLREGSAVSDFWNPPKTVIGSAEKETAGRIASLYKGLGAPVIKTTIKTAEMVKYVDNVFHAMKIAFANEVGTLSKAVGVDSYEVMDIFCSDTKLNISPAYLKPGFAFGGSCLPKDLRAILYQGRSMDVELPLLSSILPSNENQIRRAVQVIQSTGKKKLSFLGLSFKPGTDDLRESPLVILIETFIGKGYDLRIYDKNVSLARLVGANKAFIEKEIPHIANLMVSDLAEAVEFGEVIVVGHRLPEFSRSIEKVPKGRIVIDLVRAFERPPKHVEYLGLNW